jgi:tetratricopeptide (TPR) repeat protein
MDNLVKRSALGLMMAIIMLCGGGCRENADRLNDQAAKAFLADNHDEALRLFNKALQFDPNHLVTHFYLGMIYGKHGKTDEAIVHLKKAIEANPNYDGTYLLMGEIYLAKGMFDEALQAFNKVVVNNPESAIGHYKLGITCSQMGKPAEAADAFFEAGMLAVFDNNQALALNAYQQLQESGNTQLAFELRDVLIPWFDPANEDAAGARGSRAPQ